MVHGQDAHATTSRRELLKIGVSAAGLLAPGSRAKAAPGDIPAACRVPPPKAWFDELLRAGEPIVYRGEGLANFTFPLGGIGTGTVWLNGQGRLASWQIFNNIQKNSAADDSFLAVRVQEEGRAPVIRVLQTAPAGPLPPMQEVEILARYPVAILRYRDRDLSKLDIEAEAWNPLIPLNEQDSAIPCAIFTIRVTNRGSGPVTVSMLASLQNAVGHAGAGVASGVNHATCGGNWNRAGEASERGVMIAMAAEPGRPAEIRPAIELLTDDVQLPGAGETAIAGLTLTSMGAPPGRANVPSVYWISRGDLRQVGGSAPREIAQAVRERGAVLLLSGVANPLMDRVAATAPAGTVRSETTFESFDYDTFGKWTTGGEAFKRPRGGTQPNQQPVTGFLGGGLVNSYDSDDRQRGVLRSPLFPIQNRYISFLIGGGQQPGCTVSLKVEGKPVLTATGRNSEQLERVDWDVERWRGSEAQIEISDQAEGGWGHVLVDDIRFGNLPLSAVTPEEAQAWNVMIEQVRRAPVLTAAGYGRGKVMLVPVELGGVRAGVDASAQRDRVLQMVASLAGVTYYPATGRPTSAPSYGTMCLASADGSASRLPAWTDAGELLEQWAETGRLNTGPTTPGESRPPTPAGETVNGALAVERTIAPGENGSATFIITWHFPHHYYPQNAWKESGNTAIEVGNMYANWFPDAAAVARYVLANLTRLHDATMDYVRAMFDTTLPQYLVDAAAANVSILRGPTTFWTKDGTFYGFEGCNLEGGGCCPMNCNHVWNYEQTLARLWPALERNMRVTELDYHQQADGGIHHRVEVPRTAEPKRHMPVADGQCGAVLKAYREHLQSPDRRFLDEHWPRIRRAMDYAIATWDADGDGVMEKPQFNTYDRVIYGHNTFVSSLYLAALRAAEEMAKLSRDTEAARRYRDLFERGSKTIAETLFDGEYYIQKADNINLGYGTGCFSDQVVGQWWARVLGLGEILPREQVQKALAAVFKYNYLWKQEGFEGTQRFLQFADGQDKGLLCASWPKGGRPEDPILYRDEIWTGIEYQVAAHKLYEGQMVEALAIVRGARERYDGRKKSPCNEIECGDYYARAMSSWSLLPAAQGYRYDGPARLLQFDPRVAADDHRSFFSTTQAWGQYLQKREGTSQTSELKLLHGRCDVAMLRFGVPAAVSQVDGFARLDGRLNVDMRLRDGFAELELHGPVTVQAGQTLSVYLDW